MKRNFVLVIAAMLLFSFRKDENSWIRINRLGYTPAGVKVAVWCSKEDKSLTTFQLVDAGTKKFVFAGSAGKAFAAYGPFNQTYRLNFSKFAKPGRYYLIAGGAKSPEFTIGKDVYKGTADFCLKYMRQQRSGFNPFLKDSCHTHDGYSLYGQEAGIKDSTYFDVVGGWHDASDYLQYSTTSANADFHLLMAYRDFPGVFGDEKEANGLEGKNDVPDVLDEAKWGLDWLLKMHPSPDIMFNQIGDDRDHQGMRIPKEDSFYGRGYQRPVYFINGEPQQRGNFLNNTTGTSSTAAKFSSAFALGSALFKNRDKSYSDLLKTKALTALRYAEKKPGVTQTVSVRAPYIYAEDNWVDDMELAFAENNTTNSGESAGGLNQGRFFIDSALHYARLEPVTPWLGDDTAKHYQWYPFINLGHYELAKQLKRGKKDSVVGFYKKGIERVWNKARSNAFYRGVPFIWCSNNLTTSFAIQCYWYRQLSNDKEFEELEQANVDWLFGCNPWGTSMVYGLPSWGDTPADPHSSFTHLKNFPIDGGLVDGPVYTSIYQNLIGIALAAPDEYQEFQSDLAVYHDDYGDYSTNEPTMDGTASLIYLLAANEAGSSGSTIANNAAGTRKDSGGTFLMNRGAIVRGDSTQKKLAIVFSGDEFAEGGMEVLQALKNEHIKASFFFTGNFYRNPSFTTFIKEIKKKGHYLGAHSNKHLLYCDWNKRDSLLVTKAEFQDDLRNNYKEMKSFGIQKNQALYFLPPYEWYNDSIASWTEEMGLQLINYTPGTLSNADYTTVSDKNYRRSDSIYNSILHYEKSSQAGLNGFILLMHAGAGPGRKDKFYKRLPQLLNYLKKQQYQVVPVNELLKPQN